MASSGDVKVEVQAENTDAEVDFAKITREEAFKLLKTDHHGLTTAECEKRLIEFGANKLPENARNPILVYLGYMWNPLSWAMEAAAIIAIVLLDYADFALIVGLLLINATISYVEESNADKAIKALAAALAPKAKALRDGKFETVDSVGLVPGDIIIIKFGDVVPADVKILPESDDADQEETPMQIDQAALTGESLPAKKFSGDVAFSGSVVKQGERHCVVYATGVNTFFGRAATLIAGTNNVSNLSVIMTKIGGACLITIAVWVTIQLAVQFGHYGHSCKAGQGMCPTLLNMLVIIVGGIPIAMPTVLAVTLALGAFELAKEGAIVARMSAVEEMAGMDVLCSDKTGTLTLNKLSIEDGSVYPVREGTTVQEILKYGALSTNIVTEEPIDMVLYHHYKDEAELKSYKTTKYVPFNPVDKFTCATLLAPDGKVFRLLKGSPQVVLKRDYNMAEIADGVNNKMVEFANRGFRSLGVAYAEGDGRDGNTVWKMMGLLPLFDPPRHDTASTIAACHVQGIEVKMITGDHLLIGKETARMLGMGTEMYPSEVLIHAKQGHPELLHGYRDVLEMCEKCNGFAEVFPEHKYEIVAILQGGNHVVGMTGDGVNDAPALKKANIGIAVAGATDAARGAADIVLTKEGLATINTAVLGARKIFQRMTTYSKYTVSMTFRICFTFGLITVIYNWYFPTILIVILAVFNDGAMIALSKDKVVASNLPNAWNLKNIFIMGIVYGLYLTLSSWALYQTATKTTFFEDRTGLPSLNDQNTLLISWCGKFVDANQAQPDELDLYNVNTGFTPDIYGAYGNAMEASICAIPNYNNQISCPKCLRPGACDGYVPNINTPPRAGVPSLLQQCIAEQTYIRGAMMRSLLYNQVSISGQALVFVVRTQDWSLMARAGTLTYIAFIFAQIGSTLIAIFGFGGYEEPPQAFDDCEFCTLSNLKEVQYFHSIVPIGLTESAFTASVIGCGGWVLVAWIWSAIWYVLLDPIKWALCWILNEDGFRNREAYMQAAADAAAKLKKTPKPTEVAGIVGGSHGNALGRVSLSKAPTDVLDRQSASVVAVKRDAAGHATGISAESSSNVAIARRSIKKDAPQDALK